MPADFRNFAHGRHHWLARFEDITSIIALVGSRDRALAERTLALVPRSIPQVVVNFDSNDHVAQLRSLVVALHLTAEAGASKGVDPGRPSVSDFGKQLYNLASRKRKITVREGIVIPAIEQKQNDPPISWRSLGSYKGGRMPAAHS